MPKSQSLKPKTWFSFLTRLERHELTWLLVGLGACILVLAFLKLASEVMEGETLAFDRAIVQGFRKADDLSRPIGCDGLSGLRKVCRIFSSKASVSPSITSPASIRNAKSRMQPPRPMSSHDNSCLSRRVSHEVERAHNSWALGFRPWALGAASVSSRIDPKA